MTLLIDELDSQLIDIFQLGLPVVSRPYAVIGQQLELSEDEVITRLGRLRKQGLIKRLGVIVNHRRLGYSANAMVVFDVPDHLVDLTGEQVCQFGFVNLCYQRPRQDTLWPYNLYCMIHGKNREKVLLQLEYLTESCNLGQYACEVLFSLQCFKQRGALYQVSSQQRQKVLSENQLNG